MKRFATAYALAVLVVSAAVRPAAAESDGTPAYLTDRIHPALLRFADNVTFYHGFSRRTVAEMAAGSAKPAAAGVEGKWTEESLSFETADNGNTALASGSLKFAAAGNLDLERRGTLVFRIRPLRWVRSDNEPNFWPLFIFAEKGFVQFGRQGKLIVQGVLKRADTIFTIVYGAKQKVIGQAVNYAGTSGWKDEWHTMALTWQIGRMGLSIDGGPVSPVPLDHELGRASWFQIGHPYPTREGAMILVDDVIILDKALADEDIRWIHEHPPR